MTPMLAAKWGVEEGLSLTAIIGRPEMEGIDAGPAAVMGTEGLLEARLRARLGAPDGDPDGGGERNTV